jgi:hypothetical protein
MSKICPKCNYENPDNAWFCTGCGAPLANQPIDSRISGIVYKPTRFTTVPIVSSTQFGMLQSYSKVLKILSVIVLIAFIIIAFASIPLYNNIGFGGSGWIIALLIIMTGLLSYFILAINAQIAEVLTSLDIATRQSIEYQKVDHEILEKLLSRYD